MPTVKGLCSWSCDRDSEGHRVYKATFLVVTDHKFDGPATILETGGLPVPGEPWQIGNDADFWAWCRPEVKVTPKITDEPNFHWFVENTFSTKPIGKCQDNVVEDPLDEPPEVSVSFTKFTEEGSQDRDGTLFTNSSHELYHGPEVEFDHNYAVVRIKENKPISMFQEICEALDCVNLTDMWGFETTCVRLVKASIEEKYTGWCDKYYERVLEFAIRYDPRPGFERFHTWDRIIPDYGDKVLSGEWTSAGDWKLRNVGGPTGPAPDATNPAHFIRAGDFKGDKTKIALNGAGLPALVRVLDTDGSVLLANSGPVAYKTFRYYPTFDFHLLDIPDQILGIINVP